jgi:acetyl-CoA acetyltransferase
MRTGARSIPSEMGLGPVHAITPMLMRHKLGWDDIDAAEINEAFAGAGAGLRRPRGRIPRT